jgi:hypothetical protein
MWKQLKRHAGFARRGGAREAVAARAGAAPSCEPHSQEDPAARGSEFSAGLLAEERVVAAELAAWIRKHFPAAYVIEESSQRFSVVEPGHGEVQVDVDGKMGHLRFSIGFTIRPGQEMLLLLTLTNMLNSLFDLGRFALSPDGELIVADARIPIHGGLTEASFVLFFVGFRHNVLEGMRRVDTQELASVIARPVEWLRSQD